jgi:nucleoside 2-deoxyribosyltransferase
MSFSDDATRLYREILKPAIESAGLICQRADEISSADAIADDIRRAINESDLIVAEISGLNPNVMHEIGLAQSLEKPTILVCRNDYKENEIPSNIRHIRRITYPNDAGGGPVLGRQLQQTLQAIASAINGAKESGPAA